MTATLSALLNPIMALLSIGLGIGALLGFIAKTFRLETDPVVEQINDLLPQTQCGQCGYPGCMPYAKAIADGDAINKCPPGGEKTIQRLAGLLNVRELPLDEHYGSEEVRKVARIREAECIGCAKCIPACPVDAILGAPKLMHTVIESECTGCDLCVEPCPVDCIDMVAVEAEVPAMSIPDEGNYQECINCGLCVDKCPVDILPHELYWACKGENHEQAKSLKLLHCIECGKCDAVCPSHIPLVGFYQAAKAEISEHHAENARAETAKRRFDAHQVRMARLGVEDEVRRQKRAALARESRESVSRENIQAALARVRARKEER